MKEYPNVIGLFKNKYNLVVHRKSEITFGCLNSTQLKVHLQKHKRYRGNMIIYSTFFSIAPTVPERFCP